MLKEINAKLSLVNAKLKDAQSNEEINAIAEDFLTSLLDAEFASLWFYNEEELLLIRERKNSQAREISLESKKGIIYKCFMTKKGRIYNYIASDKDYVNAIDNPDGIKIKSKIILPLFDNEKLIGIVTLYSSVKKIKKFSKADMELLETVSSFLVNILYKMHIPNKTNLSEFHIDESVKEVSVAKKSVENSDKTLQVMSNFVHDIRTPANTLYGFLELLEDQISDKRVKEYVINAKESAAFINELTSAMLERVSMQREREISQITTVESAKFFANIAEMFISNIYAKQIGFNIYIDPLMPKAIEIDELKLKRTLMNLLGNANKFTPNGKNIEFSLRYNTQTKQLHVSVKDEGIGIPKEKQKEIFEAFKQADDATLINYGGTGLGLAICSEYVHDMGGVLELKSEIDKGTTFYFDIPITAKDEEVSYRAIKSKNLKIAILMSAKNSFCVKNMAKYMIRMGVKKENLIALSSAKEIPSDTTNLIVFQHKIDEAAEFMMQKSLKALIVEEELFSITNDESSSYDVISQHGYYAQKLYQFVNVKKVPKVLIVDDDRTSVVLLEKILESEYCEMEVARNGKVALEMIIDSHKKMQPYSVIYIDNNMPLMSGIEVVRNVREFERDNNLSPIFVVSTSGNVLDLEKDGKDFDLYVGKPFKIEEIRKALNS